MATATLEQKHKTASGQKTGKSKHHRKGLRLSLICLGLVALGWFIYSIFFVRRDSIDYLPEHTMSVTDRAFFPSALALADPLPVEGNRITLLHNGDQIFPALLEAIRNAKETINFEAFLFESGKVGSQFRDAFCERARAGVKVSVLLDGMGSSSGLENEDVKMMEQNGCHFAYYHPTKSWRVDQSNRRTHRRLMIVDGRVAFTGGVGFADHWQGNGQKPEEWRDVHAKIEGPLVTALQGEFEEHWVKEKGEVLVGPAHFPVLQPAGDLTAAVVSSSSFSYAPLEWLLALAFASAEKSIWITNSYCVPSEQQTELLIRAAKRGVDVRLILPGAYNDQPTTAIAGRPFYEKLAQNGVKIYKYQPSMVHAKTVVVDGMLSVFGSSNFDPRSFEINEELDIAVYNAGFAQEMERVFQQDQDRCTLAPAEDFQRRGWKDRVTEFFVLPFRSHL